MRIAARPRLTVIALASAALIALSASVAAPAEPAPCATSHLRLVPARANAAAGRRFWEMALRNEGTARCALRGYPGIGLLDAHGRLLGVRVEREAGLPIRTVTIAPGRSAYFTFAYENSGPCLPHFFSAYGISVYPPESRTRLLLRTRRFGVCAESVGGSPEVTPVRAMLEAS